MWKKGQVDIGKIIVGVFVVILILAFLGAYLEQFYGTSLGKITRKAGESIYNVFKAFNPSVGNLGNTYDPARIGWILTLVVVVLTIIYIVFLENALNILFRNLQVSDNTKNAFLTVLTIAFIGFIVISPVFNWIIAITEFLLGSGIAIGVIIFIVGIGALAAGSLIGKGTSLIISGTKTAWGGISRFQKEIKLEKLDLYYLTTKLAEEIEKEKEAEKIIIKLIGAIETIEELSKNKKIKWEEAIINLECGIEALYKIIIDDLIKRHLSEEKLEKIIEKLEDKIKKDIITQFKTVAQQRGIPIEIESEEEKEIYRAIMRELLKNDIILKYIWEELKKEDEEYKKLYKEIEKIKNYYRYLRGNLGKISTQTFLEILSEIKRSLNNILNTLSNIRLEDEDIEKKIIQIERIIRDIENKGGLLTIIIEKYLQC